jgi:hypothetical protein
MGSYNALDPPIQDETSDVQNFFKFHIPESVYNPVVPDYECLGIELYYKIYNVGEAPDGIEQLTYKTQLSSLGFQRMHRDGDEADNPQNIAIPVLNIHDYITTTPTNIRFECDFNDSTGILTVTFYNNNSTPLVPPQSFELKRAVYFPEGHESGEDYQYKGFNDFEKGDSDITDNIWESAINPPAAPPVDVTIALYAFSYGISFDPNHISQPIDSRLTWLSSINARCKPWTKGE